MNSKAILRARINSNAHACAHGPTSRSTPLGTSQSKFAAMLRQVEVGATFLLSLAVLAPQAKATHIDTAITIVNLSTNPIWNIGYLYTTPTGSGGVWHYVSPIPPGGSTSFTDLQDTDPRSNTNFYPHTAYRALYNFSTQPGGVQLATPAQFPARNITFFVDNVQPIDDSTDGASNRPERPPCGMPVWNVSEPYISLWLRDEPLGYQPGLGPRVSFELAFKQRESTAGAAPNIYSVGMRWNCSWLSYVAPDLKGSNVVYFPGGGQRTYYGTNDYVTNTRLTGSTNTGFNVWYPDGSKDIYGFVVTNSAGAFANAFLTERWNPQALKLSLYYASYDPAAPVVRLQYVVDGDGLTNWLSYNTNNSYSANLVSQVMDPFGRSVSLNYDNGGRLTNVVDVLGISTSFSYDTNAVVTAMTTPYGCTSFAYTDTTGTNVPPNGRSVLVTEPDGGSHFFLYQEFASGITNSYPTASVPTTATFSNTFDNSQLNTRDSFHWGRQQYAVLSNTNASSFTPADFRKARMRHWLATTASLVGETLSLERAPSPDTGGTVEGQKTWYDYLGKTNSQYEGAQALPLFAAEVLPDGAARFTRTDRNTNGLPTSEISTHSAAGSVDLRTNIYTYAANGIDLVSITNALRVRVLSNAYNAYHEVVTNFDALGQTTTYGYNPNQQLIWISRPTGLITTNIYSASGTSSNRLASSIDYAVIGGVTNYYRTNSYT